VGPNLLRSSLGPPHGSKIEKFVFGGLCQAGAGVEDGAGVGVIEGCAEVATAGSQSKRDSGQTAHRTRRNAPIMT